MSDDRRYDIRVTFKRNLIAGYQGHPNAYDPGLLARALRVIAGNLENRTDLPSTTLVGQLFDYEHEYGYWNLRRDRD